MQIDFTGRRRVKYIRVPRNSCPVKRWVVICWTILLDIIDQLEKRFLVGKCALTIVASTIFLLTLPIFFTSFIVLGLYRNGCKLWILWQEEGRIEVADVACRTAMETSDPAPVITVVFSLEGKLENNVIKDWLKDLLFTKDHHDTHVLYPNFRRQLIKINGFFAWKYDSEFSLDNHIITAPSHYQGTTLTERNIQEYISEMCSEPLKPDQPPWQVKVATGIAEGGDAITWVIFQMHHLLSEDMKLPGFLSSLPNPWDSNCSTRGTSLLEAPNVTRTFIQEVWNWLSFRKSKILCSFSVILSDSVKMVGPCFTKEKWKENSYMKNKILLRIKSTGMPLQEMFRYIFNVPNKIQALTHLSRVIMNVCRVSATGFIHLVIKNGHLLVILSYNLFKSCSHHLRDILNGKNSYVNLCFGAARELYWMIRAMFSLPRIILEELFATQGTVPLHMWRRRGQKTWRRTLISWGEEVPLGGAKELQGVTGASLSSVLLTALSGGVRDLLRYSGAQPPEYLRCTLPVHVPHMYPHKGLLPFALPTGCSYGQKALREVCRYLDRMRKYPETYFASVWMVKHASKFLPEFLLKRFLKCLMSSHPILLIYLVGPLTPSHIWGLKLKSAFYWRPPQHDAVISVCISTYCGRVSLGVLVDGWAVPHAHILPQSFASHLNELAVEAGVKLNKQTCKTWSSKSSTSSSRSTPSPTPPSTPISSKGLTPFSQSLFSNNLWNTHRRRKFSKQNLEINENETSSTVAPLHKKIEDIQNDVPIEDI